MISGISKFSSACVALSVGPKLTPVFHARSGFSLVELMVAGTISGLLATVMLSSFAGILGTWQSGEARADGIRDGRATVHLLGGELSTAIVEIGSEPMVQVRQWGDFSSLLFVTRLSPQSQPEGTNQSDICGVCYFVAVIPGGKPGQLGLFRTLIPSSEVFESLTSAKPIFPTDLSPTAAYTELIAQNVIRFDAKLLDDEMAAISAPTEVPKFVDTTIELIGGRQGEQYFDDQMIPAAREQLVSEHGRTFRLRHKL